MITVVLLLSMSSVVEGEGTGEGRGGGGDRRGGEGMNRMTMCAFLCNMFGVEEHSTGCKVMNLRIGELIVSKS